VQGARRHAAAAVRRLGPFARHANRRMRAGRGGLGLSFGGGGYSCGGGGYSCGGDGEGICCGRRRRGLRFPPSSRQSAQPARAQPPPPLPPIPGARAAAVCASSGAGGGGLRRACGVAHGPKPQPRPPPGCAARLQLRAKPGRVLAARPRSVAALQLARVLQRGAARLANEVEPRLERPQRAALDRSFHRKAVSRPARRARRVPASRRRSRRRRGRLYRGSLGRVGGGGAASSGGRCGAVRWPRRVPRHCVSARGGGRYIYRILNDDS
jgi:hypothetical protein